MACLKAIMKANERRLFMDSDPLRTHAYFIENISVERTPLTPLNI